MYATRILLTAAGALLLRVGSAQTTPPAATPAPPAPDMARTMTPAPAGTMHDMADSTQVKVKVKDKRGRGKARM